MSSDTALSIAAIADASAIAGYQWNDRGVAPSGYLRGMAVAFGRLYCKLNAGRDAASEIATPDSGDAGTDALAWYASEFSALGMDNSNGGADVLRHVFVLLTGLGMRESSGRYCEGRDMSAGNAGGETAEAGLFQVSHNSIYAHFLLSALYDQYKGSTDFQDIFRSGVACSAASWKSWGAGDGQDFQALTKACPAFLWNTPRSRCARSARTGARSSARPRSCGRNATTCSSRSPATSTQTRSPKSDPGRRPLSQYAAPRPPLSARSA